MPVDKSGSSRSITNPSSSSSSGCESRSLSSVMFWGITVHGNYRRSVVKTLWLIIEKPDSVMALAEIFSPSTPMPGGAVMKYQDSRLFRDQRERDQIFCMRSRSLPPGDQSRALRDMPVFATSFPSGISFRTGRITVCHSSLAGVRIFRVNIFSRMDYAGFNIFEAVRFLADVFDLRNPDVASAEQADGDCF